METKYLTALALCSGLLACSPEKQLERAEEKQAETIQKAAQKQAELQAKQQEEQQKLSQDFAKQDQKLKKEAVDTANDMGETAQKAAGKLNEDEADIQEERIKVGSDQALERDDLLEEQQAERATQDKKINEQTNEATERVQKAEAKVNAQRQVIVQDSRDELIELDQRAVNLRGKAAGADAQKRAAAANTLAEVPAQRAAIAADIEALETVKAENLKRAKSDIEKRISALDKTLDHVESEL